MSYIFLQHYWWFIVSLLGGILVFLLFVQGGNSLLFTLPEGEDSRRLMINATGRKWEFTFTTLVTFGGAFFAAFPLFYSTSFGGAYWLWMILLFTFVLQAVSYEFQRKQGNVLGTRAYRIFLVVNGLLAPFILGATVSSFFTGSAFVVEKANIMDVAAPVVSSWGNGAHGLDVFCNLWNVCLGVAIVFLARMLAQLYFVNAVADDGLASRSVRHLWADTALFLITFLPWLVHLLLVKGYNVLPDTDIVCMEDYKYLHNFLQMPLVAAVFLAGVLLVLYGVLRTLLAKHFSQGIWYAGVGTVLTVTMLLLVAGYNDTAYYPSTMSIHSSLTIANSSSSYYTLSVMFYVSLLVPFMLAAIFYTWRKINGTKLDGEELQSDHSY